MSSERTVFQSMSQKHVVSLGPTASVWEAACLMTGANCGSVLIVEPPGKLLGIVTERDLMTRVLARALAPDKTRVADVMTRNPYCVTPETPVADAVLTRPGGSLPAACASASSAASAPTCRRSGSTPGPTPPAPPTASTPTPSPSARTSSSASATTSPTPPAASACWPTRWPTCCRTRPPRCCAAMATAR